jgi:cold shock CspA family protein
VLFRSVAVRDAFDAARRRLQDRARRLEGRVKAHDVPLHGKVVRLFPYEGYGFVAASDGREIYFHKNSVIKKSFEKLVEGSEVRLVVAEKESAEGPQASTVEFVGKHH